MRTPDQDERADDGTVSEAFGDGFGSVDQGDLNDGYGTDDFYDDSYTEPEVDDQVDDDSTDADDTFDDAAEDEGGFGTDDTVVVEDDGVDVGDDGTEVVPTAAEAAEEDEPSNILEEILDDVLGGDVGDIGGGIGDTYATDTPDFLQGIDDEDGTGPLDDDSASSAINNEGSDGVFDSPFDQPDGADAADFVTESDFDLNTDGHVDRGDLREAAHPFDFHADG
jgi:hypothetical protein